MSDNDYYKRTKEFDPRTRANGLDVEFELDAISAAFDKIPAPREDGQGYDGPIHVGAATAPTHAVQLQQMEAKLGDNTENANRAEEAAERAEEARDIAIEKARQSGEARDEALEAAATVTNIHREQLEKALGVNARVYPRLTNQNLKVGDVIPAPEDTADGLPITHLIVEGNAYAMSPLASGLVTALTTSSATIGGTIVNLNPLGVFDSASDISSTRHAVGSTVRTLGFYQLGDGGHAEYLIEDSGVVDGWSVIQCVDCVAKLMPVNGEINSLQAGIFDDGVTDHTLRMSEFHAYGKDNCTTLQYLRSANGTGVIRSRLFRTERVVVKGNNAKPITISLFWKNGDSQVMVQARPFSLVSGLDFSSEMEDLELQRAGFENTADVLFEWCNFRGFRHVAAKPNAWGAYISGSRRVYLVDCGFENNSQSDFAVVDGNTDIQIIRPRRLGPTLVANIEPNGSNGNERIKISGGVYTKVYLLVNSRNSNPAKSVILEECSIDELVYDGADVTFDRVDIATIRPETSTEIYMGSLDFTNCGVAFGANLVKDHRLAIVGNNAACNWQFSFNSGPIAQMCRLLSTPNYRGVTINPDALNQQYIITNSDPILVTEQDTYLIGITGFVNTLTGGFYGNYGRIRFTDSLNNEISRIDLRPFRTGDNTNSAIRTEYAFVNAPVGATRAYIDLRNGEAATTSKLNVLSVTMNRVYAGRGSFVGVQNEHALKAGKTKIDNSKSYKGDLHYRIGMITGDEVVVGSNRYVCTDASVFNGPHFVGAWAQYSTTPA